jgi:hypothetical protein
MATTTNFGWETPDDTDLVKDGAAAIRTALNGVDTSFADLKGGTTGQVLSKASGTDLDFSWVAADDTNAIQNSIIDAKGDLIVGQADNTPARLPIGSNGYVLTAASGETYGVKWSAPAGGGKVLQVVNATYSTETSITSTSFTDSGLTATITPTASNSKIFVLINQPVLFTRNTDQTGAGLQVVRNSTNIFNTDAEAFYNYVGTGANAAQAGTLAAVMYLDSPSTTSATTYKIQWKVASSANSGTVVLQRGNFPASITLMEIGA